MPRHWLEKFEIRLKEMFPDDLPGGVYIVDIDAIGRDEFQLHDERGLGVAAYQSCNLDIVCGKHLRETGRFVGGRGFCTVVYPEMMKDDDAIFSAVCHEFAHWINCPCCVRDAPVEIWPNSAIFTCMPPGTSHRLSQERDDNLRRSGQLQPPVKTEPPVPWTWHGSDWIRAAIHVSYRAFMSCVEGVHAGFAACPASTTIAGTNYGLSPWTEYSRALAKELKSRRNEPVRRVVADEPPPEFTEVFEADVDTYRRWRESLQSPNWIETNIQFEIWKHYQRDKADKATGHPPAATTSAPPPLAAAAPPQTSGPECSPLGDHLGSQQP